MRKPECKIIVNEERDEFDSVFAIVDEVSKCLIKVKRDYGARNFLRESNDMEDCNDVLKLSLNYVELSFIYLDFEECEI